MAQPSKELIFKTLDTKRHTMAESASLFDTEINNSEYWLYTDLYNLFSHPMFDPENMYEHTYQKFDTAPAQANKIAPYEFFKSHTVPYTHKYTINSPHPPYAPITKKGTDIKLSRYACYCMFRDKPNLIFTRTYFMMPNADFKTVYETSYRFARIYQRQKLRETERKLNGILKKFDANIALFHHEVARTFFGEYTIDDVRNAYSIPINTPIADNMGAISLHARRHAIDNAIKKLDYAHTRDFRSFSMILHSELRMARNKMISEYKFPPEKDIHRTPIKTVESEYRKLEQQFIKQYTSHNIKLK